MADPQGVTQQRPKPAPAAPTLAYRSPGTPSARSASIATLLKQHDRLSKGKALGLAALGVAILLFMLSICVGVLETILSAFGVPQPLWMLWLGVGVVLVPLLFWTEKRTNGDYYTDRAGDFGHAAWSGSSRGEYELDKAHASVVAITEFLLFGPRFVLEGIGLRRRGGKLSEPVLARAADVIRDLRAVGEGMTVSQLRRQDDDPEQLKAAVAYLLEHEWIDQSRDRQRVWLLSDAKKRLADAGTI